MQTLKKENEEGGGEEAKVAGGRGFYTHSCAMRYHRSR